MADVLFILFGFSYFAYVEWPTALLAWSIQTSQTGGQLYSDTSPYGKCFLVPSTKDLHAKHFLFPNLRFKKRCCPSYCIGLLPVGSWTRSTKRSMRRPGRNVSNVHPNDGPFIVKDLRFMVFAMENFCSSRRWTTIPVANLIKPLRS